MTDYETMARRRDIEDGRRGYSIGGGGGWVQSIDGRSNPPPVFAGLPSPTPAAFQRDHKAVIHGYAILFNKVMFNNGRYITVLPGAFGKHLMVGDEIFFQHDHDTDMKVGSTRHYLSIFVDDVGVAFRLRVPPTELGDRTIELVTSNVMQAMSAGIQVTEAECKEMEGVEVLVARRAVLRECSLVTRGACGPAFAASGNIDNCCSLEDDCNSGRMKSEMHWAHMMRASRKLVSLYN
jgi:HK97 family phage prohead protease